MKSCSLESEEEWRPKKKLKKGKKACQKKKQLKKKRHLMYVPGNQLHSTLVEEGSDFSTDQPISQ